jgi:hypothetical protein
MTIGLSCPPPRASCWRGGRDVGVVDLAGVANEEADHAPVPVGKGRSGSEGASGAAVPDGQQRPRHSSPVGLLACASSTGPGTLLRGQARIPRSPSLRGAMPGRRAPLRRPGLGCEATQRKSIVDEATSEAKEPEKPMKEQEVVALAKKLRSSRSASVRSATPGWKRAIRPNAGRTRHPSSVARLLRS